MGALFGKQKKAVSRITEHDKAVLQLKQQRDKLKQYQKRLECSVDKNIEIAKKLLAEQKRDRAKLILKKKKYQEQLLNNADKQLEGLERMVQDIEFTQVELQVVEGLKVGNNTLKSLNAMLNIEDIEKIMDETKEGIEKQKEIEELISGALTEEDEADVENELLEIIGEKVELPEVPEDQLPEVLDEEVPENTEVSQKNKKEKTSKVALEA